MIQNKLKSNQITKLAEIKNNKEVCKAVEKLLVWGNKSLIASQGEDLFSIRENDGAVVIRKAVIGSLAWTPAGSGDIVDQTYNAKILDYERTICLYSLKRGNNDTPPNSYCVMIGVDKKRGAFCPTIIQEVVANDPLHAAQLINDYVARESGNGIYKFGLLQNHTQDGVIIPALTCIADKTHKFYIGDTITFDQKAQTMARAFGIGGKKDKGMTCLQYYLAFAKNFADGKASDHFLNAITIRAVKYRLSMAIEDQKRILEIEKHGGFDGTEPSIEDARIIFESIYGMGLSYKEMEESAIKQIPLENSPFKIS